MNLRSNGNGKQANGTGHGESSRGATFRIALLALAVLIVGFLAYRQGNRLFAQRRNLLRPRFHGMIADILRFNRAARTVLEGDDDATTVEEYVAAEGYGDAFVEHYLVPMGASI